MKSLKQTLLESKSESLYHQVMGGVYHNYNAKRIEVFNVIAKILAEETGSDVDGRVHADWFELWSKNERRYQIRIKVSFDDNDKVSVNDIFMGGAVNVRSAKAIEKEILKKLKSDVISVNY